MVPIVFLPGTLCDARLWKHQLAALSSRAACHIGNYGPAKSIPEMARNVLVHAPPKFILAGLSIGGIVALEMWRQDPARIQALALLDTNPYADTPERKAARALQLEYIERDALDRLVEEMLIPAYLAAVRMNDQDIRRCIHEMAHKLGPEAFVRHCRALEDRRESISMMHRIDVPTLVLCGNEDRVCPPAWHMEMVERLPHGRLVGIADAGHLSSLENPSAVTAALTSFIESVSVHGAVGCAPLSDSTCVVRDH